MNSDQGLQYVATCHAFNLAISIADVGRPTQNGYAEHLMRTVHEEEVSTKQEPKT